MSTAAAREAVKRFRLREFKVKSVSHHVRRFGYPPESTPPISTIRLPNPFIPWRNPKNGKWSEPKYSLRHQAELVKKAKLSGTLHLLPPGPKTPEYIPQPVKVLDETPEPTPDGAKTSGSVSEERVVGSRKELEDAMDEALWQEPFEWFVGPGREGSEAVREKKRLEKPGAELGTRLYAGKKRMFKGHKWERVKAHRKRRQNILMRDMAKRVYNYKNYYKKRRPNPLKPPRTTKAPKLPF
ncbi:hypothetical protein K443DRAFT_121254 [Laccaria amethystina LaAM-08-1]|uniref:Large ribosomal subunit protein mL59 domain-containing protein n=1 Tax=Laccaria amethystina LaAM-08-1 TaxID=1095629 RepID=A0A0C9Y1I7_9AGAR|nr:hypothetical protein K443DRAFT_121254 [Laccaria amethystina LaAM-08-1]